MAAAKRPKGSVATGKKREPCPKCGSPRTHRCRTGECLHCDCCEHAFFPGQLDTSKTSYAQYKRGVVEKKVTKDTWIALARDAVVALTDACVAVAEHEELAEELGLGLVVEKLKRREAKLDGQLELFS